MKKIKNLLPIAAMVFLIGMSVVFIFLFLHTKIEADSFKASITDLKRSAAKNITVSNSTTEDTEPIALDHAALKLKNPDYLCWISIPGTNIDYPVCADRADEPGYYLNFTFENKKNKYGNPFLDVRCDIDTSDVLFIYAHHNELGTMFSELHGYKEPEYRETHKTITLDSEAGIYEYTVFAAILAAGSYTEDDWSIFECLSMSQQEFDDMLQHVDNKALYSTELSPKYGDRLLALVTCEYSAKNNRLVVLAYRKGE